MFLDEIVSRGRGTPPSFHESSSNGGPGGSMQEMIIPAGKAGLIIGKGGETIKQLQVGLRSIDGRQVCSIQMYRSVAYTCIGLLRAHVEVCCRGLLRTHVEVCCVHM